MKKPIPALITATWLQNLGACAEAVEDFEKAFPRGIRKITPAIVRKARARKLSIDWLVRDLFEHGASESECLPCNVDEWPSTVLARHLAEHQRAQPENLRGGR